MNFIKVFIETVLTKQDCAKNVGVPQKCHCIRWNILQKHALHFFIFLLFSVKIHLTIELKLHYDTLQRLDKRQALFIQQARLLNIYTLYNMFVGNMVNHACMKYMVSTVYIYIFILCGNVHVHFPNHSSNILLCVLFLSLSLYSFLSSGFLVACNEFIFRHFVLRFWNQTFTWLSVILSE